MSFNNGLICKLKLHYVSECGEFFVPQGTPVKVYGWEQDFLPDYEEPDLLLVSPIAHVWFSCRRNNKYDFENGSGNISDSYLLFSVAPDALEFLAHVKGINPCDGSPY